MKATRSTAIKTIVAIKNFNNIQMKQDLKCLDDKLKERLEWSDVTMLELILVFLSWFGSLDKEKDGFTEVIEAVE